MKIKNKLTFDKIFLNSYLKKKIGISYTDRLFRKNIV